MGEAGRSGGGVGDARLSGGGVGDSWCCQVFGRWCRGKRVLGLWVRVPGVREEGWGIPGATRCLGGEAGGYQMVGRRVGVLGIQEEGWEIPGASRCLVGWVGDASVREEGGCPGNSRGRVGDSWCCQVFGRWGRGCRVLGMGVGVLGIQEEG